MRASPHKLLITRPYLEALETTKDLINVGFSVHIQPMFDVTTLPINRLQQFYDVIIITSVHAIEALNEIFFPEAVFNNSVILAVGEKTVATIKNRGLPNVLSAMPSANSLIHNILHSYSIQTKVLYLRGRTVTQDICATLRQRGYIADELIVYETIPLSFLNSETQEMLNNDEISAVLFYSTQTAAIFINLITKHNLQNTLHNKIAFCFSRNIAATLDHKLWQNVIYAPSSSQQCMIHAIVDYYKMPQML